VPVAVGQKLGRYRIGEELGAGGMGVVYRAHDEKLDRDLAIKVLAPGILDDEAARKRFRNEAKVLSRLNHPSIQPIHDFDTIDGHDLLISELVPGTSLDERVRGGPLPEKEVVHLGVQLAQGLAAAHAQGILHRDLKPANLRVTPDGRLKILDFGLATLTRDEVLTISKTTDSLPEAPSSVAGTMPYMSPEALLGEKVDDRSDIYSAGVALYEMATGQLPFSNGLVPKLTNAILHEQPTAPRSIIPKLSPEMDRILLKCLEKDPDLRYQSAKDLCVDLRRIEALTTRAATTTAVPIRRRRAVMPYGIGAAVVAVIVLGAFLGRDIRQRIESETVPNLRWEQITNFTDSAFEPAVSRDGKVLGFIRGPGAFGGSADQGQIWFKVLPDGEPAQLSNMNGGKHTLSFSADGSRLYFTTVENSFMWNTYEVPLLGGQPPKLFMANATGLNWIDTNRLMYSTVIQGVHMPVVTSSISRTDARNVYVPEDTVSGMAHRSALSPDGKWVLIVEMDATNWLPCRLVPFNGSSKGRSVGPNGACTAAKWSPDGRWMYFSVENASDGYHLWRQRFPDGEPQQLTPAGASEEEGIAVMPDGSVVTAAGTRQSAVWLHEGKSERQLTTTGFAFLPILSPDGKKVYYLLRAGRSTSYITGELWAIDVKNGRPQRVLPGLVLSHYGISPDGRKVVFTITENDSRSGIWIADLDGTQPPRQLTSGGEFRAFFGKPGEIIYQSREVPRRIWRIREDGSGREPVGTGTFLHLLSVSPDGRWAAATVTPVGGHGDRNTTVVAYGLDSQTTVKLCESCIIGFGPARTQSPPVNWSADGKWMYLALWYFDLGSSKTVAIPYRSGEPPNGSLAAMSSEAQFAKIPGARFVDEQYLFPGRSPDEYVMSRRSVKTNLFRLYLSH